MAGIKRGVLYLIPIIILMVYASKFFMPESGLFDTFKNASEKAQKYLPNVSIGAEELQGGKADVSKENRKEIINLKNTLNLMVGKGPCFMSYGGFSLMEKTNLAASYDSVKEKKI